MKRASSLFGLSLCLLLACAGADPDDDSSGAGAASSSSTTSQGGSGGGAVAVGGGGAAPACFDYLSFVPSAGVDFAADVMPIFEAHCNDGNCHGSVTNPDGSLYLGAESGNDAATLDAVHANLVGATASRAPAMQRVVASDGQSSFLMAKLDQELDCPQVACISAGCGSKMPYGATTPLLSLAERDVIRSWIENGAPR